MLPIGLGHSGNLVVFPGLVSKDCLIFLTLLVRHLFTGAVESGREDKIG